MTSSVQISNKLSVSNKFSVSSRACGDHSHSVLFNTTKKTLAECNEEFKDTKNKRIVLLIRYFVAKIRKPVSCNKKRRLEVAAGRKNVCTGSEKKKEKGEGTL